MSTMAMHLPSPPPIFITAPSPYLSGIRYRRKRSKHFLRLSLSLSLSLTHILPPLSLFISPPLARAVICELISFNSAHQTRILSPLSSWIITGEQNALPRPVKCTLMTRHLLSFAAGQSAATKQLRVFNPWFAFNTGCFVPLPRVPPCFSRKPRRSGFEEKLYRRTRTRGQIDGRSTGLTT